MSTGKNRKSVLRTIVARNLRGLRVGYNLTQQQFAEKVFAKQAMVSDWENSKHMPSEAQLQIIAGAFNTTKEALLRDNRTLQRMGDIFPDPEKSGREGRITVSETGPVYEVLKVEDLQGRIPETEDIEIRLTRVPILEDKIAAGPGRALDFARVEDWARVPRWKLKRGSAYYMIRVTGTSMEPQLHAGDLILVNLTRGDPHQLRNKLVAAWLGDIEGATVKVLKEEERGKFWILHPHNPDYKDIVVSKQDKDFQVAAVEAAWLNFE